MGMGHVIMHFTFALAIWFIVLPNFEFNFANIQYDVTIAQCPPVTFLDFVEVEPAVETQPEANGVELNEGGEA